MKTIEGIVRLSELRKLQPRESISTTLELLPLDGDYTD
jgi:hypothetical protein